MRIQRNALTVGLSLFVSEIVMAQTPRPHTYPVWQRYLNEVAPVLFAE